MFDWLIDMVAIYWETEIVLFFSQIFINYNFTSTKRIVKGTIEELADSQPFSSYIFVVFFLPYLSNMSITGEPSKDVILTHLQSKELDFSHVQCHILEAMTTVIYHVDVTASDGMSLFCSSVIFCNISVMGHQKQKLTSFLTPTTSCVWVHSHKKNRSQRSAQCEKVALRQA